MRNSNMPKSHNPFYKSSLIDRLDSLHKEFCSLVNVEWPLPDDLRSKTLSFLKECSKEDILQKSERKKILLKQINRKFRLNRKALQNLFNHLAKANGVTLGTAEKDILSGIFDDQNKTGFKKWLKNRDLPNELLEFFKCSGHNDSLHHFRRELNEATINRSDARSGVQEERREAALQALFGGWMFDIHKQESAFKANGGNEPKISSQNYFEYLRESFPEVLKRNCGHYSIKVPNEIWECNTYEAIRNWLCSEIEKAYNQVSNHSICSVLIEPPRDERSNQHIWELAGDITLFAERHKEETFKAGFFKPERIETETTGYIKSLNTQEADFSKLTYGFFYKDCFISTTQKLDQNNPDGEVRFLLLTFEKNQADETLIPCPACRSFNVRGNSYPVFGVKSWECQNPICPERSAFNRGNRYSAQGVLRQASLTDQRANIPKSVLRRWKLDVVNAPSAEVLEMLIRHFSLPEDSVTLVNWFIEEEEILTRKVVRTTSYPPNLQGQTLFHQFSSQSFFHRFLYAKSEGFNCTWKKIQCGFDDWLDVYNGSCIDVLAALPENSVDGAVTSPPYYNAREYSTWPNIYTYLYDMKLAAEGVFKVLKPGGYYLFNIFDYFDNENIFAFSDLGKKRLTLSSYCQIIFRHCGFEIEGNIGWFKGEIEGKRNYNQGNHVPFLQLPLNTWEHILVLRKPGSSNRIQFPEVVYRRPVIKMVRGENRHGHTAPFPLTIPELLTSRMPAGSVILDPFAGSFTTAIAAFKQNQKAVCIELSEEYCQLGINKIYDAKNDLFAEIFV